MATIAHLTAGSSTSNPGTTASVAIPDDGIAYLTVARAYAIAPNVGEGLAPALAGVTWEAVSSKVTYGGRRIVQVFRAVNDSGSEVSGTISLTSFDAGATFQEMLWSVELVTGGDVADPDDAPVTDVVSSGTALDLPDVGTPDDGDVIFAAFAFESGADSFALASLTALGSQTGGGNVRSLKTGYSTSDETPGCTWDSSGNSCAGIAFIINDGSGGTTQDLVGDAAGQATATGAASVSKPLAGGAAGQAGATGAAAIEKPLAGAATGQASATGELLTGSLVFTSPAHVLKNNTGTLFANETDLTVLVYTVAGALVLTKTGHTTDAAGLPPEIVDPALIAGTPYRCVFVLDSGAEGMETVVAS